jgi:hypothetical protein
LHFRSVSWCLLPSVCRFRVLFSSFLLFQGVVDCASLCFTAQLVVMFLFPSWSIVVPVVVRLVTVGPLSLGYGSACGFRRRQSFVMGTGYTHRRMRRRHSFVMCYYFLFLQEQIKGIIIIRVASACSSLCDGLFVWVFRCNLCEAHFILVYFGGVVRCCTGIIGCMHTGVWDDSILCGGSLRCRWRRCSGVTRLYRMWGILCLMVAWL